jgi:AraC-like DNA-binding protein
MSAKTVRVERVRVHDFSAHERAAGHIDWNSLRARIGASFVDLDVTLAARNASCLDIDILQLPGLFVSWHASAGISMDRGRRHLCEDVRDVTINIPVAGCLTASQDQQDRLVAPGQAVLLRAERESRVDVRERSEFVSLKLPEAGWTDSLSDRLGSLGAGSGPVMLDARGPSFVLLRSYLFGLRTIQMVLSPADLDLAKRHIMELVEACLDRNGDHPSPRHAAGDCGDADLARLRQASLVLMQRHYQDATVTMADVAGWLSVPASTLMCAFEVAGQSFDEALLLIRIGHLGRSLRDPALARKSVIELALQHGLDDAGEVAAGFDRLYGTDPDAYRRISRS